MGESNYLNKLKSIYFKYLWWVWQTILVLVSVFFMIFGIQLCIYSYQLNDPFNFILTFFASNLIILISGVLLIGFVYRMIGVFKLMRKKKDGL